MIDIFAPDYLINRLHESLDRKAEEAKRRTPEEHFKYMQSLGIIDENGDYTPEYRFLRLIKQDH